MLAWANVQRDRKEIDTVRCVLTLTSREHFMKIKTALSMAVLAASGFAATIPAQAADDEKLVIAHRGASGYLPEHTLEAKTAAYFMGVDYIEQDVVMTKDDQLVVLHDHYLDRVTDVVERFPDRYRMENGKKRWFAIDFTLAEIKQLRVTEGFKMPDNSEAGALTDKTKANFPGRFPLWKASFRVPSLQEEIELIQGLNKTTGRNVGIYPEIKAPWFHRHEGKDISKATLAVLKQYGYTTKNDKVFLQCFDPIETQRINNELMPAMEMDVNLVQLIAETSWNETMVYDKSGKAKPYNYDWMFEPGAMAKIAKYADGVGPWKPMIVKDGSTMGKLEVSNLVKDAHAAGMKVHPYTFRLDKGRIPEYASSFEDMLDIFYYKVGVDGVFTDFPDRAVDFVRRAESKRKAL